GQKDIVTIKYSFPVGIEEKLKDQPKVVVYPNPFSSQAIISIAMEHTLPGWTLDVYDVLGEKVISQNIENTNQTIITKNNLPNGLYFFQAIDKTKILGSGNFIIAD
ncbi:MAG: T9SS type A sorting domain-containing protein, partial [Bacteroidota bacterium]|nr:T9SS type A sorting domain-containing protein [Bacteroidota bacterium]